MEEPTDRTSATAPEGLTPFQIQVAQLFFSLPASNGFLLAGGAALVAQHLTTRATQDLDFFTGPGRGDVPTARDAFEIAALFDRAEARDFVDVYILAQRYPKSLLLARAADIDGGFDLAIFTDMLDTLSRFTDTEIPMSPAEVNLLREFLPNGQPNSVPD